MRKLYTVNDIESLANAGQRALTVSPNDILTPLALDRARELGLQVQAGRGTSSAAPSPRTADSRPPILPPGLAADAFAAFTSLLHLAKDETANAPHLNQCFGDLLRAVEQGEAISPPVRPEPIHLPKEHQQRLTAQVEKMDALARYLFGPESSHRRFDILWALTTLKMLLNN